jgi:NUMOD3 motif
MYIYYVYQYLREDLTPYYIGKGKHKRAWHFAHTVPIPKDKTLIQFIAINLSEHEAHLLEQKLIKHYGRKDLSTGILRNRTDGGEGMSGFTHSVETKEKMCKPKSYIAKQNMSKSAIGRTLTIETKQKISASLSKSRKPHTEETKAKIALAQKGISKRPCSDATKKKLSIVMQGNKNSSKSSK